MRKMSPLSDERGQAAAEFALVMPILIALVLAIAQFGIAFNNYLTITDAVRAGARIAAVSRFSGDNGAAARAAVMTAAPNLDQTKLLPVVTSSSNWLLAGTDVTVTATYPYSINILGWVVSSGLITSTTKERLE